MVNYGSIYFEYAPSDPPSTYKFLEFFEKLLSVCKHYKTITTIDNIRILLEAERQFFPVR